MALVSKRFKNPHGYFVDKAPASMGSCSSFFEGLHGAFLDTTVGNQGVGFSLCMEDGTGRSLEVYLTHAELDRLIEVRDQFDAEYGRGKKP